MEIRSWNVDRVKRFQNVCILSSKQIKLRPLWQRPATRRARSQFPPKLGGALRDIPKNGYEGAYFAPGSPIWGLMFRQPSTQKRRRLCGWEGNRTKRIQTIANFTTTNAASSSVSDWPNAPSDFIARVYYLCEAECKKVKMWELINQSIGQRTHLTSNALSSAFVLQFVRILGVTFSLITSKCFPLKASSSLLSVTKNQRSWAKIITLIKFFSSQVYSGQPY